MNKVQEAFIYNLKNERKRAGLSQEKLAEKLGLSYKYISAIEIGNRFPSLEVLQGMVDVFDIQPYELFLTQGNDTKEKDEVHIIDDYTIYLQAELKKAIKRIKGDFLGK
jgi:transcriptional regulator with XRE-family HTH domain